MRPRLMGALVLGAAMMIIAAPTARASEGMQAYDAVMAEYDKAMESISDRASWVELNRTFLARFEALAEQYAGEEAGLKAEIWRIGHVGSLTEDRAAGREASAELLRSTAKTYAKSPMLGELAAMARIAPPDEGRAILETMAKSSPHRAVQGQALVWLARTYTYAREPEEHEKAKPIFEKVLREYANEPIGSTTCGAIADATLHPHPATALAEGAEVPEIVGIDQNGEPMTLSKFRGKVVLLDFWGDW